LLLEAQHCLSKFIQEAAKTQEGDSIPEELQSESLVVGSFFLTS
jgi:hypothetical protein